MISAETCWVVYKYLIWCSSPRRLPRRHLKWSPLIATRSLGYVKTRVKFFSTSFYFHIMEIVEEISQKNPKEMVDWEQDGEFTSSSTHRLCVHDGQWSSCVDRGHGDPSSDAYLCGRGSSWVAPSPHAILSRPTRMSVGNICRRWCPSVCSRTNLGSCIDVGWRWLWQSSRPKTINESLNEILPVA